MRTAASLGRGLVAVLVLFLVVPAIASARPSQAAQDRGEVAIVQAVNAVRAQNGLGALASDPRLARAADLHTAEMIRGNFFDHGAFAQRVRRYVHKRSVGENLAMLAPHCGASAAARFVDMWMRSAPHRAVLLSSRFAKVGIGRRAGRLNGASACIVTADFSSAR
jgi:uncharacterized protein YkwD